jgi:hypothetical protein
LGIISAVVEVGTKNIPDFIINMKESIDENFSALLRTLREAKNYSKNAPKRVSKFIVDTYTSNEVTLKWNYEYNKNIYFEIYRNTYNKEACNSSNLIVTTSNLSFKDTQLNSSTVYYYIRTLDIKKDIKSAFVPKLKVKTKLEIDEFAKTLFLNPSCFGYVSCKELEINLLHFAKNSLFIGINRAKGIAYGVLNLI